MHNDCTIQYHTPRCAYFSYLFFAIFLLCLMFLFAAMQVGSITLNQ